jgi:hypothetical protein
MAQLKSTIEIEVDGIKDFLATTKQVEKELLQIQSILKKEGFKGNKEELEEAAKAYRTSMLKAINTIDKKDDKRIDKLESRTRRLARSVGGVGREALGTFIGGGLGETFGIIQSGLADIIEKTRDENEEIGDLADAFDVFGARLQVLGEEFLTEFADPIEDGLELVTELFFNLLGGVQVISDEFINLASELTNGFDENSLVYRAFTFIIDTLKNIPALIAGSVAAFIEFGRAITRIFREAGLRIQRFITSVRLDFNKLTGDDGEVAKLTKRLKEIDNGIKDNEISLKSVGDAFRDAYDRAINRSKELREANDDTTQAAIRRQKAEEATLKRLEAIKASISLNERTASEVQADIDQAIAEDRLKDAQDLIRELKNVKTQYDNNTESLRQAKETQTQLNRELANASAAVAEVKPVADELERIFDISFVDSELSEFLSESLFRDLPDDLQAEFSDLLTGDGFFKVFVKELGISEQDADDIFARVASKTKSFKENIEALAAEGITSPIINEILERATQVEALEKQISDNQKKIDKQGVEVAEKNAKFEEQILASEEKLQKKRDEIVKKANKATVQLFRENLEFARKLGDIDLFNSLIKQEDIFTQENDEFIEQIEKNVERLNNVAGSTVGKLSTEVGDAGFQIIDPNAAKGNEALIEEINQQVQKLINTRKQQKIELENLENDLAEIGIAAFRERFSREEKERRLNLEKITLDIRDAKQERDADIERFNNRAKAQDREFNDDEIKAIEEHRDKILTLERERFEEESFISAGAYLEELTDLKNKNINVEVETKRFQLEQRKTEANHQKEVKEIVEKGSVDIKEERDKSFLNEEEAKEILDVSIEAFRSVYDAYVNYQNAIGQATIDALSEQLAFIDTAISETTSKIDSLESDLAGKRSGRREALLRGIEIERAREEELTERRIKLQQDLAKEEKRQSQRRKAAAISQALINGALAITNIWANNTLPYPAAAIYNGIQTAATAAITGFEIATIEAQTFGRGGFIDFGKSHAQGGVPAVVNGQTPVEIEKGEAIINKHSTAMYKPLLSAINEAGGGVKFARGGIPSANFDMMAQTLSRQDISQLASLANQPIYVNVTDIANVQARQAEVTNITSI